MSLKICQKIKKKQKQYSTPNRKKKTVSIALGSLSKLMLHKLN